MTARRLLNRVYLAAIDGQDADGRAEIDLQLNDPLAFDQAQRQRTLDDLLAAGGEI